MDAAILRAHAVSLAARGVLSLPGPLLRALAGTPPAAAAELEPEAWCLARLAALAERLAAGRAPAPLADQRRIADAETRLLSARPGRPVHSEDREAGGVPVRLYVPETAPSPPAPTLVFLHGGGWAQRSIRSHDPACRLLAHLAGVRVVSVEYRLAPEHPYPAAVDDARAAYEAVAARPEAFGAGRIAVGGDSAGGNLAAVTALTADPTPAFQWLLYPATDAAHRHPSAALFGTGYYLTEEAMDRYTALYLPDPATRSEPRASPLLAPDLAHAAPAYVATAAADPLRDEAEAYAERLREAGVAATTQRFGLLHGFLNLTGLRGARDAVAVAAGALRAGLR